MTTLGIFEILAGLAVFLYGIRRVTETLDRIGSGKIRQFVKRFAQNRIKGFFVGVLTSFALQSSGATVLMLVTFANAGILTVIESIPIILGAGVGSTLTVQILAFKIYRFAPIMISVGFFVMLFGGVRWLKNSAEVLFSFGLVFIGISIMRFSLTPIQNDTAIIAMIEFFSNAPFWVAVAGSFLAAIFQGSTPVLGFLITLAFAGIVNLNVAIPTIIGANVGTCAMTIWNSFGSHTEGKRIVWVQVIMRFFVAAILFASMPLYKSLVIAIGGSLARQIAVAHTLFDIFVAIIFLPSSPLAKKIAHWFIPETIEADNTKPKYLDTQPPSNPLVAAGQACREIMRMGEIVVGMLVDWGKSFYLNDKELLKSVVTTDDKVDRLQEAITQYLTKISYEDMDSETSSLVMTLIHIALELEHIGDVISKDLSSHVRKKIDMGYYFSDQGFMEIMDYHSDVKKNLEMVLASIPMKDEKLARHVINDTKRLVQRQRELYRSHLRRLHEGIRETEETSTIHIDIISDLNKINLHTSYIAYAVGGTI